MSTLHSSDPTAMPAPAPAAAGAAPRALQVLLIEDNHGDVRLVREAVAKQARKVDVSVAYDGGRALNLLRDPDYRPDLILLDLNLPRVAGRSLLGRIKADPKLRRTPVIVLTSSDNESEVTQAYDLHANAYLIKPKAVADFERVIRETLDYWSGVVHLPGRA